LAEERPHRLAPVGRNDGPKNLSRIPHHGPCPNHPEAAKDLKRTFHVLHRYVDPNRQGFGGCCCPGRGHRTCLFEQPQDRQDDLGARPRGWCPAGYRGVAEVDHDVFRKLQREGNAEEADGRRGRIRKGFEGGLTRGPHHVIRRAPASPGALADGARGTTLALVVVQEPGIFSAWAFDSKRRQELIREPAVGSDGLETINVLVARHALVHREMPAGESPPSPAVIALRTATLEGATAMAVVPHALRHTKPFRVNVLSHSHMGPIWRIGRLGHRGAPWREQGDGWRADRRAGALLALSMLATETAVAGCCCYRLTPR